MARGTYSTSNYFSVGSAPATAAPVTLACWFNPNATSLQTLMQLGDAGATNYLMLYVQTAGVFSLLSAAYDGSSVGTSNASTVSTSTWQHACAVFTSTTSRQVYLDGSAGSLDTTTVTPTGIDDLSLGRRLTSGNARVFDGYLAEAGVWSVALTAAEIAALAAGYSPRFIRPQSLIFYAPLVRSTLELTGTGVTESGTVGVVDHPSILNPTGPLIPGAPSSGGTTYEDSLTLGKVITVSQDNNMVMESALTAAKSLQISPLSNAIFENALSLGRSHALTLDGGLLLEASLSLAKSLGFTTTSEYIVDAAVSLARQAAMAIDTDATFEATLSVNRVMGVSQQGNLNLDESASFARSLGFDTNGGLLVEESLSLARSAGADFTTTVDWNGQVSFGKIITLTPAVEAILEEDISLAIVLTLITSSAIPSEVTQALFARSYIFPEPGNVAKSKEHVRYSILQTANVRVDNYKEN